MPFRQFRRRLGKTLGGIGVAQLGQRHIAALRRGLRGVEREAIEFRGLDFFDLGQKFIRFSELPIFNGLLRVGLQCSDFRVIARLRRRCCLEVLVFFSNFQKLRRETFGRHVGFADDRKRALDLALVEIELLL
jgi:hypothetical protein